MNEKELTELRHNTTGLYKIKELALMFDISRFSIDAAIKSGKLEYISPNNRDRYIKLNDFLEFMKKNSNCSDLKIDTVTK